jgi:hypothetical protein
MLWLAPDESLEAWLRQRFKSTFGAAALDAIRNLCPDIGEDGLTVDIDPAPEVTRMCCPKRRPMRRFGLPDRP